MTPLPSIQDFDWLIILGGDMGLVPTHKCNNVVDS